MIVDKKTAQKMLAKMMLIRRFEERAAAAYRDGHICGFCHLYIGQEAVVVGAQESFKSGDAVITSYRDHAHMLSCDMTPRGIMAELFGKKSGYSKGKGGSMHMFSIERGFFGGHGIVGAQVPLGTGLALALKMQKKDNIAFTYFGDGACAQGQVYESFNMANLYDLPVLYIIENNGYAMGTAARRHSGDKALYERAHAFDIESCQMDGMDVLKVQEVIAESAEYVRSKKRPFLIEAQTYRYVGHSVSDPGNYMPKEEKQQYKDNDPIGKLSSYMLENGLSSEEEIKAMDNDAKASAKDAYVFAENDDLVSEDELMTDIMEDQNV
ncbi:MAG: pyruvate dehydrogenase (acetyl-transferring) E1 component subunit alpha [Alphaproteobacteria bacterium]|nr:pyruvate dehydrogenase (acetyl-transferring) E1 component subunit alpha [Alphaproteobacteria bacterium]